MTDEIEFRTEYAEEHKWLFANGDVEVPKIKTSKACDDYQIHVRPFYSSPSEIKIWESQLNVPMAWADETLTWAVETILRQLSSNVSIVPDSRRLHS